MRLRRTRVLPIVVLGLSLGLASMGTIASGDGGSSGSGSSGSGSSGSGSSGSGSLGGLSSLKGVKPPLPAALDTVVKNRAIAIALGKALFWDSQVGSDGQACASCHFQAGADNRTKNQLNPGFRAIPSDTIFDPTRTGGIGPNYQMKAGDFPFHVLSDPLNRDSSVLFDSKDVHSSVGTFAGDFVELNSDYSEKCTDDPVASTPFHVGNLLVRKVEPRNTPTTINAIFQLRTFWDGRANNHFNGQSIWGRRDVNARVFENQNGTVMPVVLDFENAALASQAVGPVGSDLEMGCRGINRTFATIGRKLMNGPGPLSKQHVDSNDSVLKNYAAAGKGLMVSYGDLIKQAYHDKYWNNTTWDDQSAFRYNQMESNFAMFWGLAVMLYESTLVSDDAPFDRYAGGNRTAMTDQQVKGLGVFTGKGKCAECHTGPDITDAGFRLQAEFANGGIIDKRDNALVDDGFHNIGARPTNEDQGIGANGAFGPLSFTRQFKAALAGDPAPRDVFQVNITDATASTRDAVDGAVKTPSLRNIELTGPYMHNGGMSTLEQVVDFYSRGGDRRGPDDNNTSGFPPNPSNVDRKIQKRGFGADEKAALVAFLKALTDDRVRCEKAPFDHPELTVFVGNDTNNSAGGDHPTRAADMTKTVPAVGANGGACLKPFSYGLQ